MQYDIVWEGDTDLGHYQIADCLYDGRAARVLYSGDRRAAQSGIPKDGQPDMLFDYNQRLLELATAIAPGKVLLLGGGVGTLPAELVRLLPNTRVDVVEPDRALTKLGYDYFNLPVDDRLHVFHTDGRTFLNEHASRYDMVMVDAFTHTTIPAELKTEEAFRAYQKHLRPSGLFAMNVISGYYGPSAFVLRQTYAAALRPFDEVDIFLASRGYSLWLPQNFILTAQKGVSLPLRDYVRHDGVKPPEVSTADATHDQA
ncbi:MAG TPA: fused MFS/spermidine synthase [Candidatus Saccharimonadales bacterium]|nr:fused MFS/spermidine synthase [Candidatus Saccharimonadales bacterium]